MYFRNRTQLEGLRKTRTQKRSNPFQRRQQCLNVRTSKTGYEHSGMTKIRCNPNLRHRHLNIMKLRIAKFSAGENFRQNAPNFLCYTKLSSAGSLCCNTSRTLQINFGTTVQAGITSIS